MTEDPTSQTRWSDSVKRTVNGKPLDAVSWTTSVLTVAPGKHRLKNALGLTVGLYLGRQMMNVLVGEKPDGEKIAREDVPLPLRPLHGRFAYNRHSDDPKDRWMKVVDNMVPAALGAVGAIAGSYQFFEKNYEAVKSPEFIDDYEKAMTLEQSKPWSVMSGMTSLMGSASGLGLGPAGNYGASLGTRFTLASWRKVAMPGLGKFLTNSHSIHPFGPTRLIDKMIDYASANGSENPKQLESMAYGILGPWFKNIKPEQIEAFVGMVKGARDQFLAEGGVPEEAQGQIKSMLTESLKGEGLERTLKDIGLNPAEASLGDNGFATLVSKILGKAGKMAEMQGEFAAKYAARQAESSSGVER